MTPPPPQAQVQVIGDPASLGAALVQSQHWSLRFFFAKISVDCFAQNQL